MACHFVTCQSHGMIISLICEAVVSNQHINVSCKSYAKRLIARPLAHLPGCRHECMHVCIYVLSYVCTCSIRCSMSRTELCCACPGQSCAAQSCDVCGLTSCFWVCRLAARATQETHRLEALPLVSLQEASAHSPLSHSAHRPPALAPPARLLLAKSSPHQPLALLPHQLLALAVAPLVRAQPQPLVRAVLQLLVRHQLLAHSPLQHLDKLEVGLALRRAHQLLELLPRQTPLANPHLLLAAAAAASGLGLPNRAPQASALLRVRQHLAAQALEPLAKVVLLLLLVPQEPQPLGSNLSSRVPLPSPSAQEAPSALRNSRQALVHPPQQQVLALLLPVLAGTCLAAPSRVSRSQLLDLAPLGLGSPVQRVLVRPAHQRLVRLRPPVSLEHLHSQVLATCLGSLHPPLVPQDLVSLHSSSSSQLSSRDNHSNSLCQ